MCYPPRNFYTLTGNTILTQRYETVKMAIPWMVTSQLERGFGGEEPLGGPLSRYRVVGGVTTLSSLRFWFVVDTDLCLCGTVSVIIIVIAEMV